ncbi:hypothetical protein GCM10009096_24210 [Parasphingorhabdus litoris]|uniref:Uncharacterized protein n=1 Tax=Parasphingorhabdus litoris TaxID=394733 RepID=A0ABN1API8_9SPHN|nr:hypothetical protein [Parasphingorhabdus litoris]
MLPLFDRNILSKQVESAMRMGAEKIILLSPTMHGGLLQYADGLRNSNVKIDIVRNASDLQEYPTQGSDLVFLADGVFPDEAIERKLSAASEELIYVVSNADEYQNFERIDLTHRWLGIAVLRSERLSEIAEIPDDWDVGSALLRTAVQAECKRELVSDADMQMDAVPRLQQAEESAAYAIRQLNIVKIPKQNWLDRFAIWPLMRKIIPLLWKSPGAKNYTGFASLGAGLIALIMALFGWPVLSLGLLLTGSLAIMLHRRLSIFSRQDQRTDLVGLCFHLLAAAVLTVAVVHYARVESLFAHITILLLLFGILWIIFAEPEGRHLNGLFPDIPLILLILFLAAALNIFLFGLYFAPLFCLLFIIAKQRLSSTDQERTDPIA